MKGFQIFPLGCVIQNIRNGVGDRSRVVYATLVDKNGIVMISATLEYIYEQLCNATFVEN